MIWGNWWRGYDGEDDMTEEDWHRRGENCVKGMFNGLSPEQTNPDETGTPTYGWYNGDYTEEEHERANQRLNEDEEYLEEQSRNAANLHGWFNWWKGNEE